MQWSSRTAIGSALAILVTLAVAPGVGGKGASGNSGRVPLATDWSHHHLIFSAPPPSGQAASLQQEPRFWQQWLRRNVRFSGLAPAAAAGATSSGNGRSKHHSALKRDWSVSLGQSAGVSAGQFPAKFSFDVTTANCGNAATPDYVVFPTSVAGSATQASIVAFDNLYSGCTGVVPSTYWAYNTGGAVVTSPILSLDGSQIAFVQSNGVTAQLVLLRWQASGTATSTSPGSITTVTAAQYPTCTAPCMTALPFANGANDLSSSPFLDYSSGNLYVGDFGGALHKFTNIFNGGTPAEVTTGGWPVSVAAGLMLSSPVFDSVTGRVFVGSPFNGTSGGQLFAVAASSATVVGTSSTLAHGAGIAGAPIVDSSAGQVYVFVGNDGTIACVLSNPCSAVYQFAASFTSGSGIKATMGPGNGFAADAGDFDNAYFTSSNATGNLFVCGTIFNGVPGLRVIAINAGTMSTTARSGPSLAGATTPCSPVTEIFNPSGGGAVDRIFASVGTGGNAAACSNAGCIMSFNITAWQPSTAYLVGQTILDSNLNIEIATVAGTSKSGSAPLFTTTSGNLTTDGTVTWANQGLVSPITPGGWQANSTFSSQFRIIDSNQNLEIALFSGGTTGSTQPVWPTTIGATVIDGGVSWRNVGPMTTAGLGASGGTSGIIIDNTVSPGVLAGASEVYYSPLGLGSCGVGNGCAVQASQAGLK